MARKRAGVPESAPSARPFLPERRSIAALREAARGCRGCPLYRKATQTVFGEGGVRSRLVLVGEMPGDGEDREGRPFVGPAGRILDRALAEAGIHRDATYVTNVVKHFKWEPRGKRRIHKKPNVAEVLACRPWLDAELEAIEPHVIVALGATAAAALIGRAFSLSRQRGQFVESALAPYVTATIHPSAVLRQRTDEDRHAEMRRLIDDLRGVAAVLSQAGSA